MKTYPCIILQKEQTIREPWQYEYCIWLHLSEIDYTLIQLHPEKETAKNIAEIEKSKLGIPLYIID